MEGQLRGVGDEVRNNRLVDRTTDRPLETIATLALMHWASGERPQRLMCEEIHSSESEHQVAPADCYLSDEDAEAVELLSSVLPGVITTWLIDHEWGQA